jgi:hypothetical protein
MAVYSVGTVDVDGPGGVRRYKTLKRAVARFQEMAGFHPDVALADEGRMALFAINDQDHFTVRGVSMYGCMVTLRKG